ncbi:MAG: acyl-CoA dehydrogenase [Alphaproteobacteria bacterium]|nr:acyl-CoA dehydrogenase [Alphaproteobacteria bacterium]
MPYTPPTDEMQFVLEKVLGFEHPELDSETIAAVLGEAAKLAGEVLAPLNSVGDRDGCMLAGGHVKTPAGFRDAYRQYCEGGWNAVPFDPAYGGQGLPWALAFPVQEMWQGANMSFGLCPLLNQGAVEALHAHGSDALKETYLPKLITGEWTGTMNLTEPQAGSDLSVIRTKAEKQGDGTYKITGQKIYITYGEHDFSENIVHLVLARSPDGIEGSKGLSLYLVPKFLEDGTRNDVVCTGLEHKLGIHASPTCTMQYGDRGGATGFLVGRENEGLKCMFTMMNNARLSVGLQGMAISEAATQMAEAYALERVQGVSLVTGKPVPIAGHGDVQRMLVTMRVLTDAGRMMSYYAASHLDKAAAGDTEAQKIVELLTPVVKAWCTDRAVEVASLGIQVHGGIGYAEETGAAQFLRDARILPIYEGTNGVQSLDFVFRKIARDKGAAALGWLEGLGPCDSDVDGVRCELISLVRALSEADPGKLSRAAEPALQAFGTFVGAVFMARATSASEERKDASAFYEGVILPRARAAIASAAYLLDN